MLGSRTKGTYYDADRRRTPTHGRKSEGKQLCLQMLYHAFKSRVFRCDPHRNRRDGSER